MSRRLVVFGVLALFLFAAETAFLSAVGRAGAALHLGLGVLFFAAVRAGDIEGVGIAALVGYGWDLFAGTPTGLSVAPAVAIFVGVRVLSQRVEVAGFVGLVVLGFVAILFHGFACLVLLAIAGGVGNLAVWSSLGVLFRGAIVGAIFVPAIYGLSRFVDRFAGDEKTEAEVWLK